MTIILVVGPLYFIRGPMLRNLFQFSSLCTHFPVQCAHSEATISSSVHVSKMGQNVISRSSLISSLHIEQGFAWKLNFGTQQI